MTVMGLEIERRERVLDGALFGTAGAYAKITGVLRLAVDATRAPHERIADIVIHAGPRAEGS
jgi:hypothetical protein